MFHIHIQMKNENEMRKYMLRTLKCENGYFKDHLFSLWFGMTNPGLILIAIHKMNAEIEKVE